MALNLWKLGGKKLSYSPMPTGTGETNIQVKPNVEYLLTFKAMSPTETRIRITGSVNVYYDFNLAKQLKFYSLPFTAKESNFYLYDILSKGDIIIEDIQLVEKPLPKLTINGIDGFLSGKWTKKTADASGIYTFLNDEEFTLETNTSYQYIFYKVNVPRNTEITFSAEHSGFIACFDGEIKNALVGYRNLPSITFNTLNNDTISLLLGNFNIPGKFTFKRPTLNLGTTPAPYEKKRGERMVLPVARKNLFNDKMWSVHDANTLKYIPSLEVGKQYSLSATNGYRFAIANNGTWIDYKNPLTFTPTGTNVQIYLRNASGTALDLSALPFVNAQLEQGTTATQYESYNVQLNPKPKRLVPGKNLFDGRLEIGTYIHGSTGVLTTGGTNTAGVNYIPVKQGLTYTISNDKNINVGRVATYDAGKNVVSANFIYNALTPISTFTIPNGVHFIRFHYAVNDDDLKIMLTEGTTATPFEPYKLQLPRAREGLRMENAYVQLPSMTMDAIEIDCLIDEPKGDVLIDMRNGLTAYVYSNGAPSGSLSNGGVIPRNQRVKYYTKNPSPFTASVRLFANFVGTGITKGILYNVKCYLKGEVVAEYDFTNPNNIVGDKLIPNAKNLIPSFEDKSWSLNKNFKTLGERVGRLDAPQIGELSYVDIPVSAGKTYLATVGQFYGVQSVYGYYYQEADGNVTYIKHTNALDKDSLKIFTFVPTRNNVRLRFYNNYSGSVDFINPQLYELTGKEATIYGNSQPLRKAPKRVLYAKR